MAFLVEETLGNFDFRILRVSISLGTKFQRNRLVLIRAQAGLRKGVVASAISSMQTVWWGRSRLAYPGVTLFSASAELLRWRLRTRNGKPSDRLCRRTTHALGLPSVGQQVQGLAFNGSSDKHHGTEVDHDSTVTLTESIDSSCTWTRESRSFRNHTSRDLSGHDSFCVASKQTKNKVLVKTERRKKLKEANLPSSISACSGRDRRSCIVKVCKWTVVRVENQAGCAVEPALFP